jgi:hypothetical protein
MDLFASVPNWVEWAGVLLSAAGVILPIPLLGHGYVSEARDVLNDMHRLIFNGEPPPRFGLKPRENAEGKTYWEVGA